jgi:chromosome segregation ATPase
MIELLSNWTFLFINFSFISYFFYLKNKNKYLLKHTNILEKCLIKNKEHTENISTEIQNLSNDLSKKTNDQMEIRKKYNNMIYEFKLYKEINYNLEKDNEKLIKSDKKYKTLFEECKENNFTLEKDYKNLNHDMDKLADSYKDLYKSRDDITNDNKNLKEKINDLEQDICEVEADIFMYKNTRFDFEKKIQIANQIEEEQKIEILKLRNLLKNEKKKLKKSKSFFKRK